jgi:hypothetical protein
VSTVFVKPSELTISETLSGLFRADKAMIEAISEAMKSGGYDTAFPVVCSEVGGYVVDGHTRIKAAKKAGVSTIPVIFRRFEDESEAVEYAIKCQRNRRNLTDAELVRCIAELDKRRQRGGDRKSEESKAPCGAIDNGKSAEETADALGISSRKVERARTVIDHAPPEVRQAVEAGDMSINAAYTATQAARKPKRPELAEIDPYSRYYDEFLAIAKAKKKDDWPDVWKAMEAVARELKAQHERTPND